MSQDVKMTQQKPAGSIIEMCPPRRAESHVRAPVKSANLSPRKIISNFFSGGKLTPSDDTSSNNIPPQPVPEDSPVEFNPLSNDSSFGILNHKPAANEGGESANKDHSQVYLSLLHSAVSSSPNQTNTFSPHPDGPYQSNVDLCMNHNTKLILTCSTIIPSHQQQQQHQAFTSSRNLHPSDKQLLRSTRNISEERCDNFCRISSTEDENCSESLVRGPCVTIISKVPNRQNCMELSLVTSATVVTQAQQQGISGTAADFASTSRKHQQETPKETSSSSSSSPSITAISDAISQKQQQRRRQQKSLKRKRRIAEEDHDWDSSEGVIQRKRRIASARNRRLNNNRASHESSPARMTRGDSSSPLAGAVKAKKILCAGDESPSDDYGHSSVGSIQTTLSQTKGDRESSHTSTLGRSKARLRSHKKPRWENRDTISTSYESLESCTVTDELQSRRKRKRKRIFIHARSSSDNRQYRRARRSSVSSHRSVELSPHYHHTIFSTIPGKSNQDFTEIDPLESLFIQDASGHYSRKQKKLRESRGRGESDYSTGTLYKSSAPSRRTISSASQRRRKRHVRNYRPKRSR